jgi:SNF2 family DNA or RNA helicase
MDTLQLWNIFVLLLHWANHRWRYVKINYFLISIFHHIFRQHCMLKIMDAMISLSFKIKVQIQIWNETFIDERTTFLNWIPKKYATYWVYPSYLGNYNSMHIILDLNKQIKSDNSVNCFSLRSCGFRER